MANNWIFPPAPPPPPQITSQQPYGFNPPPYQAQWAPRGRGGFGNNAARGSSARGGLSGNRGNRGGQSSGYSYQQRNGFRDRNDQTNGQSGNNYGYGSQNAARPQVTQHQSTWMSGHSSNGTQAVSGGFPPGTEAGRGFKRQHEQAFPRKPITTQMQVAPSVPSFGLALPSIPQPPKVTSKQTVPAPSKKTNLLGLTPADDDDGLSDEDEEAKLANMVATKGSGTALTFEYKGQLATLRTPEDIAAWVAERRRNFPTAARREMMLKKRAEERERVAKERQAAQKKVQEAKETARKTAQNSAQTKPNKTKPSSKSLPKSKEGQKKEKLVKPPANALTAPSKQQLQIEKIRKAMEKNAKKLAKLEAAVKTTEAQPTSHEPQKLDGLSLLKATVKDPAHSEIEVDDESDISTSSEEETSSSGSSSDEDDDDDSNLDSESERSDVFATEEAEAAHTGSGSDSDAPEELASSRKSPLRVPPPKRIKADSRPMCRDFKKYGKCTRKYCKFRHQERNKEDHPRVKVQTNKPPEKLSLYQRLLKQQIEEDEQAEATAKKKDAAVANSGDDAHTAQQ